MKQSAPDQPCKKGEDIRSSELCAQWKAADAAKDATELSLWLGIFGTFFGAATLAVAVRAAFWARDAAKATEGQLANSTRVMEAELRPWIPFHDMSGSRYENTATESGPADSGFAFQMKFLNSGKLPAMFTATRIAGTVKPIGEGFPEFPEFEPIDGTGFAGPGDIIESIPAFISKKHLDRIARREDVIWFHCRVDYRGPNDPNKRYHTDLICKAVYNGEVVDESGKRMPNFTLSHELSDIG